MASTMDAIEAIKASELVASFGKRAGNHLLHQCLLTRVPAALKPRTLASVVAQLRAKEIDILPAALIEKEAFKALFEMGGDLDALEARGVSGVPAARRNIAAYVDAVSEVVRPAEVLRPVAAYG